MIKKKNLLWIVLLCFILICIESIWAIEFDNVKLFDEGIGDYGKITIKNLFGLGSTLIEIELKSNTEHCELGKYCSAEMEIILHKEGSLIDNERFLRKSGKDWIEGFSVKYKFYYRKKGESDWKEYNLGYEVEPGIYEVLLEGEKPPRLTIDWQIRVGGYSKFLKDWALWGDDGVLQYYDLNDTTELVSGTYNLEAFEGIVTYGSNGCLIGDCVTIGVDDNLNLTGSNATDLCSGGGHTFNFWVNASDGTDVVLFDDIGELDKQINMYANGTVMATINFMTNNKPVQVDIRNFWQMITLRTNATNTSIFINGSLKMVGDIADCVVTNSSTTLYIGTKRTGGDPDAFQGQFDEMSFWNISLTDIEIDKLYNEGVGLYFESNYITLISPEDGNITLNPDIIINCSAEAPSGIINISSYHNLSGTLERNETIELTGLSNSTEINMTFPDGITTWTCSVGSSNGVETFSYENRTINVINAILTNQTFNNGTIEGNIDRFTANISRRNGLQLAQANLVYNNTINFADFSSEDPTSLMIIDFLIPDIIQNINVSFYWNFIFGDGSELNTSITNQTIFNISMDNCSTFTNQIFNFTLVDEETQVNLTQLVENTTIETAFNLLNTDRLLAISNFSQSFNNTNLITICLNRDILNNTAFSLDAIIRHEAEDHVSEYYNIIDYTLDSNSTTQEIILFNLLTADSTEFQLTFTGSDFLAVENALIFVKRQYVSENVFKTVELPKTDSNGQTILHLVRNDFIYNIEVMKDGVVVGNFENMIAFCDDVVIGDCKITLSAAESGEVIFNYDDDLGITYTGPTYDNETRIITFNFLTTNSSVKTVLMNATRNDIFGNISICSASIVSSGGTLTCEVPSYIDDSIIITKIFVDGKETLKDYTVLSGFNYGKAGYFIFFIYMLAFIFMFSRDKTIMLIGIIVGFIVGISLGLISGRLMGIGASGIWLVIVIILMVWKLNKERPN